MWVNMLKIKPFNTDKPWNIEIMIRLQQMQRTNGMTDWNSRSPTQKPSKKMLQNFPQQNFINTNL